MEDQDIFTWRLLGSLEVVAFSCNQWFQIPQLSFGWVSQNIDSSHFHPSVCCHDFLHNDEQQQATDVNRGQFKSAHGSNLWKLTEDTLQVKKTIISTQDVISLLVFGGKDLVTEIGDHEDAFSKEVSASGNKAC